MKRVIQVILVLSLLQSNISFAKSDLQTTGDILQIAIPAAAIGIALYKDDKEGQKEFIKSFLVNTALTQAVKFAFRNTSLNKRPDGGNYSFPSGHTAAAAQGAFFLQTRYGIEYGAPAIAGTILTGYSRVQAKKHYWRDVIGGAAIAFGVNYFFVTKYNPEKVNVTADIGPGKALIGIDLKL